MKVAIDVSPLKSEHRFRGIGFYTRNLVESLQAMARSKANSDFRIDLIEDRKIQKDTDLIHYPFFDLFRPSLPLVKKRKTIVTVHDVIPLIFPRQYPPGVKGRINLQVQKFSLKGVGAVITDSLNSQKDIVDFLEIPPEKVHVVYLAPRKDFKKIAKGDWREQMRKKYSLPARFVLYVGDVNYHKNVLALAAACKKIKIPLVIAGKQAAQNDFDKKHVENRPLKNLIDEYGRDPEIIRLGFVPDQDLPALYNLAGVYCQPSFYEGFGLSVLEAMACGTPVVATNLASLPEICGKAAVMVDSAEPEGLARGIKTILADPRRQRVLEKKGIRQAKKFSWEKTALATSNVYRQVHEG